MERSGDPLLSIIFLFEIGTVAVTVGVSHALVLITSFLGDTPYDCDDHDDSPDDNADNVSTGRCIKHNIFSFR